PEGQFVGVWTVLLEDIHPDSGPLSYVQGSHRFRIDQRALYRDALSHTRDPAGAPSRSREISPLIIERARSGRERTPCSRQVTLRCGTRSSSMADLRRGPRSSLARTWPFIPALLTSTSSLTTCS